MSWLEVSPIRSHQTRQRKQENFPSLSVFLIRSSFHVNFDIFSVKQQQRGQIWTGGRRKEQRGMLVDILFRWIRERKMLLILRDMESRGDFCVSVFFLPFLHVQHRLEMFRYSEVGVVVSAAMSERRKLNSSKSSSSLLTRTCQRKEREEEEKLQRHRLTLACWWCSSSSMFHRGLFCVYKLQLFCSPTGAQRVVKEEIDNLESEFAHKNLSLFQLLRVHSTAMRKSEKENRLKPRLGDLERQKVCAWKVALMWIFLLAAATFVKILTLHFNNRFLTLAVMFSVLDDCRLLRDAE
mgnify:CR=1 FL=1